MPAYVEVWCKKDACAMRDILNPQTRWSKKMDTSRRRLLAGIGGLSLGAAVSAVEPRQANAMPSVAGSEGGEELVAVAVNDALEGAYGRHKGKRRNHTKGFGTTGYFVGTKEAAQLSRSALFDGDRIEVIARLSLAGADPSASDSERSPRGMGLEFRLKNGALHHMTMIHTPMFFARTPSTFLDKFLALAKDVHTGKADPSKLTAFMKQHPVRQQATPTAPSMEYIRFASLITQERRRMCAGVSCRRTEKNRLPMRSLRKNAETFLRRPSETA